ncbi:sensor histidine kinase [Leptospira ognonensis]|uniref:Sensor histidine kinase n=1 Tax=Leptospira ognonensis TaxID=2484945 RepID=A0A4R9JYE5_9LEPT|nr:sensor histidine kinase [Leptospira ognonensis]
MFDVFYSTKQEGEGSVIGLLIVKQIADKQNGFIWVKSVPGRTVFMVKLSI